MKEPSRKPYPPSPCIGVCALDDDDHCTGCRRTLDEIVRWSLMSPAEQRAVIGSLAARKPGR